VLSLQSYVTPPSLKSRSYTSRRMPRRIHLTSNFLQITMTNRSTSSLHLSLMITATLIPTAVLLSLVNHSRRPFRKSMRERTAIPTLPAPLRTFGIRMISIITITPMVSIMIATMVIITTALERYPLSIGVQHLGHPCLRMYTPMVIQDHDLFLTSHPSA
jgi:hypothetical protein